MIMLNGLADLCNLISPFFLLTSFKLYRRIHGVICYKLFSIVRFSMEILKTIFHKQIGTVLKKLFEDGVVKREKLFITSKIWYFVHNFQSFYVSYAFSVSLPSA